MVRPEIRRPVRALLRHACMCPLVPTALAAAVVSACYHQSPTEPFLSMPDASRVVPGVELGIVATWAAACEAPLSVEPYGCDSQPFTLDLRCTDGPCEVDGAGPHVGRAEAWVRILELGRITIAASITHDADGETLSAVTELQVVQPERFTTMCNCLDGVITPDCNENTAPADRQPDVNIWPMLGGDRMISSQLRINGREPAFAGPGAVSADLAQLYPASAVNGLMKPGTYELRIELAGVTEVHPITVR